MAVPGRVDAAALLLSLEPAPWFVRHARAVAEVAGWLALATARRGGKLDRRLVEGAALLHDADKALPAEHPLRKELAHGAGSAQWLATAGFAELGPLVATHPVIWLADGTTADAWLESAPLEDLIVAYADKRAGQRLESVDARFGGWRRRYPPGSGRGAWSEATIESIRARVGRLEERVCDSAGVRPAQVRRLAWTGPALAAARSASGSIAPQRRGVA